MKNIYLASRSPRRRELLKQIGVVFQVVQLREDPRRGADVDETPKAAEAPADYVLRVARAKAELAVHYLQRRSLQRWPVLAADTTVGCDQRVSGKPDDAEDAIRILTSLSGRPHEVISAVAVALAERVEIALSLSKVWFRKLSDDEVRRYVASGESFDKAGAYAVQGRAAAFVTRIEGSYSGIMGLPLAETADLLAKFGVDTV